MVGYFIFNTYSEGGVSQWVDLKSTGRAMSALNSNAKPLHEIDASIPATICLETNRRACRTYCLQMK